MVISRFVKIIGGALGTGIVAIVCYQTASLLRRHFDQDQDVQDNISDSSRSSFNATNFRQGIGIGLTTVRFLRDMYDIVTGRSDSQNEGGNDPSPINNPINDGLPIQRDDPAGGDTGENEPIQPQREEFGAGDAPYFHN